MRPTRLVDFEGIAKYHNVNIMLYEPKKNSRSIWQLAYGKIQYKNDFPTMNMVLLGGHCVYIKKMDVLCGRWECKGCRQIFTRNEDLIRHLKEEGCTEGKTKIICPGGKFRNILNSLRRCFMVVTQNLVIPPASGLGHRNTFITKCDGMVENAWCRFGF